MHPSRHSRDIWYGVGAENASKFYAEVVDVEDSPFESGVQSLLRRNIFVNM